MLAASRAEDGCITYSYAIDVQDPGLIRVFEVWRDQAALDAHRETPHFLAWKACRESIGMHDRRLSLYEVSTATPQA